MNLVEEFLKTKRPLEISEKNQAIWVGNQVELMEGFAKVDLNRAIQLLKDVKDVFYKNQLQYGIFVSLLDKGLSHEEAKDLIGKNL